jgi:hypothetical protein
MVCRFHWESIDHGVRGGDVEEPGRAASLDSNHRVGHEQRRHEEQREKQ